MVIHRILLMILIKIIVTLEIGISKLKPPGIITMIITFYRWRKEKLTANSLETCEKWQRGRFEASQNLSDPPCHISPTSTVSEKSENPVLRGWGSHCDDMGLIWNPVLVPGLFPKFFTIFWFFCIFCTASLSEQVRGSVIKVPKKDRNLVHAEIVKISRYFWPFFFSHMSMALTLFIDRLLRWFFH